VTDKAHRQPALIPIHEAFSDRIVSSSYAAQQVTDALFAKQFDPMTGKCETDGLINGRTDRLITHQTLALSVVV